MKGDENRYLVLGKADVVYDLPKILRDDENMYLIWIKDDVVFWFEALNAEESASFFQKYLSNLDSKFGVLFLQEKKHNLCNLFVN